MFPNDDPRFDFVDDPVPPEPDVFVLEHVMARGRQRLIRRRALLGGVAVAIVVLLLSGGAAVAQHRTARPGIAVQPADNEVVIGAATTTTTTTATTATTTAAAASGPQRTPTAGAGTASPALGVPPTTATPSCITCPPGLPLPPGTQAATAGDFTGEVKVSPTEVNAGGEVGVELDVQNASDHSVDVEGMTGGPATAVVCANDLTPDGVTNEPLHFDNPDANIFWIISGALKPGDKAAIGPMNVETTAAEQGVVTCEAVLVGARHDGLTMTSFIIARIDNIPAVTYTVLPAPDASSTTTTTVTSTTTPGTTVPSQ
jgi:hypothetical protein